MIETLQSWWHLVLQHSAIVQAFLVVFATLLARYFVKLLLDRLAKRLERTQNLYDDAVLAAGRKPLGWAIWVFGITWAAQLLAPETGTTIFSFIAPVRQVTFVGLLAWFGVRFVSFVEVHITDPNYGKKSVDNTTVLAIGKLLRASIVITAILSIADTLGFSVTGVLAFGGLGGIAVGFAAKDLLANFFGAMMIFLDRPFSVGDWIRSADREIEGTVENIGWRLTRIRTFDQRPLYVPNSVFTSISVENPSRMLNRRIYETIGVRYSDVVALPALLEDIRSLLKCHPDIDHNRTLMVNFNLFGPSSLDFFIYTFTRTTVWTEYHAIKEQILLKIADIIQQHGAEIAFPTRTVHLEQPPEPGA